MFLGNCIVTPENNLMDVCIVNVTPYKALIDPFKIKFSKLDDYDLYHIISQEEIIQVEAQNKRKNKIIETIRNREIQTLITKNFHRSCKYV